MKEYNEVLIAGMLYVLGSIPISAILAKILGMKNPADDGSGNIGFSNSLRVTGNFGFSFTVALLGMSVGYIGCLVGDQMLNRLLISEGWKMGAFFVLMGNLFSVFGMSGKGISVLLGILVYKCWWNIALLPAWMLIAKLSYPVVGSMMVVGYSFWAFLDTRNEIFLAVSLLLIIFKHKVNIQRLLADKEQGLDKKKK